MATFLFSVFSFCFLAVTKIYADDCDAYVDIVPHLQPISGNCSQLKAQSNVNVTSLNGRTWVVHYDSHAQANPTVCEFFSIRVDDNTLYTTEVVQKSGTTVVLHEKMRIDKERNGTFYESEDEKAVIFSLSDDLKTICFAECGRLKNDTETENKNTERQYGAHVFCAATNALLTRAQDKEIQNAQTRARDMGLNITFKRMRTVCYQNPTHRD